MLQKSLIVNIVFNYQPSVSLVKIRKCFTKFIISIALFQQLRSQKLVSVAESDFCISNTQNININFMNVSSILEHVLVALCMLDMPK